MKTPRTLTAEGSAVFSMILDGPGISLKETKHTEKDAALYQKQSQDTVTSSRVFTSRKSTPTVSPHETRRCHSKEKKQKQTTPKHRPLYLGRQRVYVKNNNNDDDDKEKKKKKKKKEEEEEEEEKKKKKKKEKKND